MHFQDHTLLASSLQTAYNLRVLPDLVQSLLNDLSQAVDDRIRSAFDISKISKDVTVRGMPPVHVLTNYIRLMSRYRASEFSSPAIILSLQIKSAYRANQSHRSTMGNDSLDSTSVYDRRDVRLLYQGEATCLLRSQYLIIAIQTRSIH